MIRIVHISDLHLPIRVPINELGGKRMIGYLNFLIRRKKKYPFEAVESLLEKIKSLQYDICILSGDIVNIGTKTEFIESRSILKSILNEKIFVIPGNHDRYNKKSVQPVNLWSQYYGEFAGGQNITSSDIFYSKLINGYTFIGFDSTIIPGIPFYAGGKIGANVLNHYQDFVKDKKYFAVLHHPIWNPADHSESKYHSLSNKQTVMQAFQKNPPIAVFHGHVHSNWISIPVDDGKSFYTINSASSCRIPDKNHKSGFHYLEFDEYKLKSVVRYSYSPEQKYFIDDHTISYNQSDIN